MGGLFFTKKQKAQMKERRKKMKLLTDRPNNNKEETGDNGKNIVTDATHGENQTEQNDVLDHKATGPSSEIPSKKRPRQEHDEHGALDCDDNDDSAKVVPSVPTAVQQQSTTQSNNKDLTTKVMDGKLYVLMPSNLSSKEAKKFRKDARRQLRDSGQLTGDDDNATFVTQEDMPSLRPHSKKAKTSNKEFPSIKLLLKQKHEMEQLRKEETKLKEKLNTIPESIRAQYVALDCEMVGIGTEGKQSALARVSLVDWNLNVLLDTFVQVPMRVTDFRTHVSGVEPKHIKNQNGAMEVKLCRDTVAQLIKGKILVGHALTNDFKALMLSHPKDKIRDTSKYRPFQRYGNGKWRARKLRDLVKENLKGKEDFQAGEHDSVLDAKATMELFQIVYSHWEKELSGKTK
jgi:RNA exonuclease 4